MAEPITNVLGIVGMENKGAYDADAYYEKLNVVSYQGSSYCALDSVHNVLPTDTTKWQLIAEKGDKGDTGEEGYTPIKGTDYYTAEDKAELESTLSYDVTSEVTEQLEDLVSATPLAASSVAGMTDTTRIYVNTTDGHWYWYDGDSWEQGGLYQSSGIADNSVFLKSLEKNLQNDFKGNNDLLHQALQNSDYLLNTNDGTLISMSGYSTTDFIPVEPNTTYYITHYTPSGINILTYGRYLEYGNDKSYLNLYHNTSTETASFTTGANTYYIRASYPTLYYNYFYLSKTNLQYILGNPIFMDGNNIIPLSIEGNKIIENSIDITCLEDIKIISSNLYNNEAKIIEDTIINEFTGEANTILSNYFTSNYQRIKANTDYITNAWRIAFYDNNLNLIKVQNRTLGSTTQSFTTPTNASFYRLSDQTSQLSNIKLGEGASLPNDTFKYQLNNLSTEIESTDISNILHNAVGTLKIKLIGDSITYGVGATTGKSWASLLENELENNFNCNVINNGVSGITSQYIVENLDTLIGNDADIVICMIGTNNRISQASFNRLYGDLQTIYEYCIEKGSKFIPMASVPASITDEEREDGTFNVRYKHMEDINHVISAFSSNNKLEYIDLFEPFYMYAFTKGISINDLLADGLHPNDDGYYLMFRFISHELGVDAKIKNATW